MVSGMTTPVAPEVVPESERGYQGNVRQLFDGQGRITWVPGQPEPNWVLRFPDSVGVFDQMRDTDSQVGGLLRAITLPCLSAEWDLNCDGVSAEVEHLVRAELGLPGPGEAPTRRRRGQAGIDWLEHLREALLCLPMGFMVFEQVAVVTVPGDPGHPVGVDKPVVHLRKLGVRLPSTIDRVDVDDQGSLLGVTQRPVGSQVTGDRDAAVLGYSTGRAVVPSPVSIPVDRLVVYCPDREGGNWYGKSILRTAYKDWLIKDQLVRINAQAGERNGMGLPVVYYDNDSGLTREQALALASQVRAGATAGAAMPPGTRLELLGITGSTPDLIAKIKYHDEAIARLGLAMFLNLGHDNGAKALGDTFLDVFRQGLNSITGHIANVATEHIVRDLVEWNYGPDEPYPTVVCAPISTEAAVTPDALKVLHDAGVLTADDDLEQWVRSRYDLPPANPTTPAPPVPPGINPNQPLIDPSVDPNAPFEDRVNQPIPDTGETEQALRVEDTAAVRYAATLMDRVRRLTGR